MKNNYSWGWFKNQLTGVTCILSVMCSYRRQHEYMRLKSLPQCGVSWIAHLPGDMSGMRHPSYSRHAVVSLSPRENSSTRLPWPRAEGRWTIIIKAIIVELVTVNEQVAADICNPGIGDISSCVNKSNCMHFINTFDHVGQLSILILLSAPLPKINRRLDWIKFRVSNLRRFDKSSYN